MGGMLMPQNPDPGAFDPDLIPGAVLRWPPCKCGNPNLCPDYAPSEPGTEEHPSRQARKKRHDGTEEM
jgi:hypothetical protein